MRDVNGKEFRPGAVVRRTFVYEGIVDDSGEWFTDQYGNQHYLGNPLPLASSTEVLEDPRMEEPTALGTIVLGQCSMYSHDDCRIVLADPFDADELPWWCSIHGIWVRWDDINEPSLEASDA